MAAVTYHEIVLGVSWKHRSELTSSTACSVRACRNRLDANATALPTGRRELTTGLAFNVVNGNSGSSSPDNFETTTDKKIVKRSRRPLLIVRRVFVAFSAYDALPADDDGRCGRRWRSTAVPPHGTRSYLICSTPPPKFAIGDAKWCNYEARRGLYIPCTRFIYIPIITVERSHR